MNIRNIGILSFLIIIAIACHSTKIEKPDSKKADKKPVPAQTTEKPLSTDTLTEAKIPGPERWTLVSFDGEKLTAETYPGEIPFVEINMTDSTISGYAGCNKFRGSFTVENNLVKPGPVMATKKACNKLESEQILLNALQNPFPIPSGQNIFTLSSGDHTLTFTKHP